MLVSGQAAEPQHQCPPHPTSQAARHLPPLAQLFFLSSEGTLEPQIEDLIHRIYKLQQAKKKSGEELGETQALWEALNRELDSLNGENLHLEEVLNKKQEALRILQQHRQAQESGAPRSAAEEQLKDPVARHKALWEFRVLEQRLAREIRALERSQEQLRAQGSLVRARLQEVEQRLRPAPELGGAPAATGGPEAEIQSLERRSRSAPGAKDGGKGPGQTWRSCGEVRGSSAPQLRDLTAQPRACCSQASDAEGEPEPQAEPAPTPPKAAAAPRPGFREADPK
nr:synaptonemal complex central element protein 1-like [Cavia porcellus]